MTFASLCWRPSVAVVEVPDEGGAHAVDLVRGDRLTVAGTTDDDPERARVGDDALSRGEAERRVVVLSVVLGGAVVDDLVALGRQVLDEVHPEVVTGVVGSNVNAHAPIMP